MPVATKRKKRNPVDAAAKLSEAFHGRKAQSRKDYVDEIHEHAVLTELGDLVEIKMKTGPFKVLKDFRGVKLAYSELPEQQMYVVGGKQAVPLKGTGLDATKGKVDLGEVDKVTYATAKFHLGREDRTHGPYEHLLAEEGGTRPLLIYDVRNQRLEFVGGTYRIDVDMDGKYSAGIRD